MERRQEEQVLPSYPARVTAETAISMARCRGGQGMIYSSHLMTPKTGFLASPERAFRCFNSYISCRHGISGVLGSKSHGSESRTALVNAATPEMELEIGPSAEPIASSPRRVFRAPAYGSRCNVGRSPYRPL
jgi:hypothetical protein